MRRFVDAVVGVLESISSFELLFQGTRKHKTTPKSGNVVWSGMIGKDKG